MQTSLNDIEQIEAHLFHTASEADSVVFEARVILDGNLREQIEWQQQAYAIVELYGRKQLRAELEAVHQKLFHAPEHESFRQKVFRFFSNR
ncbi:MAG: hypothetical protein IAF08_05190 [Rhizobacter sp.]|nr:hypothetical protein [Chlorobiales bacterium]